MNLLEHKGLEIEVLMNQAYTSTDCLGCEHLHNTGYSYICTETGEKLEGYDSMKDMKTKNHETYLPKHMGIGVGFQCPLPKVHGKICMVTDLLEEKVMCTEEPDEECGQCGMCGVQFAGKCCMDTTRDCTGCMCC